MDRTDGLISQLIEAVKSYLSLQKEYAMLELTEKLIRLLTALILGAILFVLGIIVLVFLGFTLVELFDMLFSNPVLSYALVTFLLVCVGVLIYIMRKQWLEAPLTNLLTNILLKNHGE